MMLYNGKIKKFYVGALDFFPLTDRTRQLFHPQRWRNGFEYDQFWYRTKFSGVRIGMSGVFCLEDTLGHRRPLSKQCICSCDFFICFHCEAKFASWEFAFLAWIACEYLWFGLNTEVIKSCSRTVQFWGDCLWTIFEYLHGFKVWFLEFLEFLGLSWESKHNFHAIKHWIPASYLSLPAINHGSFGGSMSTAGGLCVVMMVWQMLWKSYKGVWRPCKGRFYWKEICCGMYFCMFVS